MGRGAITVPGWSGLSGRALCGNAIEQSLDTNDL